MKKRHEQKLVINGMITFIVLNVPLLLVFDKEGAIYGIPVLYFAIFGIWIISIVISYVVLKRFYE